MQNEVKAVHRNPKSLWDLPHLTLAVGALFSLAIGTGVLFFLAGRRHNVFNLLEISGVLGVLFVLLHGASALGWKRFLAFAFLGALIGYWVEVFSMHYTSFFGCPYHYHPDRWNDKVLGMPLTVALFWAVFIYGGYAITNSFLAYFRLKKPGRGKTGALRLLLLLPLIDATIVTAIDVFMDPLVTWRGSWIWEVEGPFYGVPIGNFVGWFVISWLACFLFRAYEFFRPARTPDRHGRWGHLAMALAYGLLMLMFAVFSLSIQRPEITLTGLFAMGPVLLLNLLGFSAARETDSQYREDLRL